MTLSELLNRISPHSIALVRQAKNPEREPTYIFREGESLMHTRRGWNNGHRREPIPADWHELDDFLVLKIMDTLPAEGLRAKRDMSKTEPAAVAAAQLEPAAVNPVLEAVRLRMAEREDSHHQQVVREFQQTVDEHLSSLPMGFWVEVNNDLSIALHGPYPTAFYDKVIRLFFDQTSNWQRQKPKKFVYSRLLAEMVNQRELDEEETTMQLRKFKQALEALPDPLPVDFDVRRDGDNIILTGKYYASVYQRVIRLFFFKQDGGPGKEKWRHQRPRILAFTDLLLEAVTARRPKRD